MSAAAFPAASWVLLEPFVFRRDGDDDSFPDESKAPIRASATTSWGATFTIAFSLADPPNISRIYAHLPGFTDRSVYTPLTIVATHRHLSLFEVVDQMPPTTLVPVQDLFVYIAGAGEKDQKPYHCSSLRALPTCTEPYFDYSRRDCHLPRRRRRRRPQQEELEKRRRLLTTRSMGLLCRGEGGGGEEEEFAVAELNLYRPSRTKVFADICLLRSSGADDGDGSPGDELLGGEWKNMRVDVLCSDTDSPDDDELLYFWDTDTVVPFRQWLCWIDYDRGILFCDVFKYPTPTVSFLRLPLDEFPSDNIRINNTRSFFYRGVSVVGHGRELKFVNVARHDGIPIGALKPGTGFTITCHTLLMSDGGGGMAWEEDYRLTSDELWDANLPEHLPRDILMYPQVDIDRPHVVHFLYIQFGYAKKKMWVVSIDMSTKIVESCSLYINGWEGLLLHADDRDLIEHKSLAPMPFLPCEFPKFLHSTYCQGNTAAGTSIPLSASSDT